MPKISVIICAYNAADTLKKAALSVLSQSFRDLELIIVNDGSKDATLSIATELKLKDNRVKVINKENGGLAKARNTALHYVSGEYVSFCDADDYIDDGAYETMFDAVQKNGSDVVLCGYYHETQLKNGTSIAEISSTDNVYGSKQEIYRDFVELKSKYLLDTVCNKLIKYSVIADNGLLFPEGELFEDTAFVLKLFEVTQKLTVINKCFYHYVQYMGQGITRRYDSRKKRYLTDRYKLLLDFCRDADDDLKSYCHLYHIRNMFSFVSGTYGVKEMTSKERKQIVTDIISDDLFKTCTEKAKATSRADKICLAVAKAKSLFLTKAFCKGIFLLKHKAAVAFTKFKR